METDISMQTISTSWHGYPKVYNLGHKYIREIFSDDVLIEEKIDGSQFSFGRFGGILKCRSKGCSINPDYPEKMFKLACDYVKSLDFVDNSLHDGWTYRGEFLAKPRHNSLVYERVPLHNIIIFDINTGEEDYLSYEQKKEEAQRIGLETVPLLYNGKIGSPDEVINLLDRTSILGGQKIEGFVVKNYNKFTDDKKAMMGKLVSEAFKEVHQKEWKNTNPGALGIIELLIGKYKTPARWDKALLHLKEEGKLQGAPEDIGFLIQAIGDDIEMECSDEIKADLFKWGWSKIRRGCMAGFPEYYKERLLRESF